jgi:hypothetical protein
MRKQNVVLCGSGPLGSYLLHISLFSVLSHGIAAHLKPVTVMNQPVKDAVGQGWVADLFVPSGTGNCDFTMVERT